MRVRNLCDFSKSALLKKLCFSFKIYEEKNIWGQFLEATFDLVARLRPMCLMHLRNQKSKAESASPLRETGPRSVENLICISYVSFENVVDACLW